MKRLFFVLSAIALLTSRCDTSTKTPTASDLERKLKADSIVDAKMATFSDSLKKATVKGLAVWSYKEDTDRMTSKITYFAMLSATDYVDLSSPYHDVIPFIKIRKKRGETDAMFGVTTGQLHHEYDTDPYISVRFDTERAQKYYCGEPSDGSSNIYFIHNSTKFISKLKQSKTVLIETEFYQDGLKVMTFHCEGLKWDH